MARNFGFPQNFGQGGEDAGNQFAGGVGGGFLGPGRIVEHVQVYNLPSGKIRELRQIIETVRDEYNNFRTNFRIAAGPPFDCSCMPEDMEDIAECSNPECRAIVCKRHSFTCQADGRVYCTACGVADEYGYFRICRKCWRKMTTPRVVRWIKSLLWGEE
jgi:hypothetical protein